MPSLNRRRVTTSTPPPFDRFPPLNSKVLEVLWELKKKGRAKATIKNIGKLLTRLEKLCDLDDPEAVRTFIATFDRSNAYKKNLCFAYDNYVKVHGLQWERPVYFVQSKVPKIPLESQIDCIIADSSKKLAVAISISRDTGLRPIELMNLRLRDVDLQKGAVYPTTAKHGSPRVLKLSQKTLSLLNKYLAVHHIDINDKLFGCWNSDIYGKKFRKTRNRVAYKTGNETIKGIRLYDLRHYFATMLYHRTNDLLFVMQQMGHRKITTTMIYTQLLQFENDDAYTCRVAQTVEQDKELIENGFEFVTERDGLKIYRKRK